MCAVTLCWLALGYVDGANTTTKQIEGYDSSSANGNWRSSSLF
jgi:hypothetical protein